MIRKIKHYFYMRRLQKRIQIEVLDTLATICLWLNYDGQRARNPKTRTLMLHFEGIKHYSDILKEDVIRSNNNAE